MKRIALMHYAYPPEVGGVEKTISNQAVVLSDLGYSVKVIAGMGVEDDGRIDFVRIPQMGSLLHVDSKLHKHLLKMGEVDDRFLLLANKLETEIAKNLADVEVVIVHNMLTLVHNLPFIYAFKNYAAKHPNKRIIVWVHDQTFIDNGRVTKEKKGVVLSAKMRKLLVDPIPQAHYVTISERLRDLFAQVSGVAESSLTVVPDGLMLRKFLEIDDAVWYFLMQYDIFNKFPILLAPVNILRRKNLDFAISIVSHLEKDFPGVILVVTGTQSIHRDTHVYKEELLKQIEKLRLGGHVIFLTDHMSEGLSDKEIHDFYTIADCVLYFSKQENFGIPMAEAFATRSPLFVSDLEVFHEIGEELVEYIDIRKSPAQTARKIASFIKNDPIINRQFRARTKYNLYTIIKAVLVPLLGK